MAKLLYVGTSGTDDPTRATFPFLMAKGAIEQATKRASFSWGKLPLSSGTRCPCRSRESGYRL